MPSVFTREIFEMFKRTLALYMIAEPLLLQQIKGVNA